MNGWQTAAVTLCVVTGKVFDSQHHAVPSAKVIQLFAGKKELATETNSDGVIQFSVPADHTRFAWTIRTTDHSPWHLQW